ncbi:bifunctional folylpolyglutamate synthase/dihydrofolate synthase [Qipengyuania flava]|uniref:bifunctional folylpolyglutamate synthase/dihydrofolate synthase n=1 Tax=Qipengyuania flava TaxID=192812 RepID=UPI001C639BDA|nr:folylpolyglutamate synthase/dihydrofolate synthase family protein [Qipengyuania flava]QYJ06339.1 bifunctional folylpolyglutamate synthase/dihydrofolate synthase [Qipengyuania flava]
MRDFARSDHEGVQAQLDRLGALSVPDGRLGLETIRALLDRLGNPHRRLPPVFHIAGTNGKGSTCAFLRAMLEADGYAVHVTTSPHLVRYNERIRVAGTLIEDDRLAALLAEVLDAGEDLNPSFFEVTIAAAFTEFARVPADACVVEVGLGGRFDATNVLEPDVLAACGIAALGIDHERFLLAPEDGVPTEPIARIAFEKAGIAKAGVPLVTLAERYDYPAEASAVIRAVAEGKGSPLFERGSDWGAKPVGRGAHPPFEDDLSVAYADDLGHFHIRDIAMRGRHQALNVGLATAMIRHQSKLRVSEDAITRGAASARWPARLQRLSPGALTGTREVWLDGGHNPSAGDTLAAHFEGRRMHLVLGMLSAKDPAALTGPLAGSIETVTVVPVPGHDWHGVDAFGPGAKEADTLTDAMASLPEDGLPVLIAGSLYLAGEALRLNGEMPD